MTKRSCQTAASLILHKPTVHLSSILRARDDESRHEEMSKFVADLKKVATAIRQHKAA